MTPNPNSKPSRLLLSLCMALLLVAFGCKKDAEPPPPVEDTSGYEEPEPEVEYEAPEEMCSVSTVYFEFDSSELDSSSRAALEAAAECFRRQAAARPDASARLLLTGACDPRGTEEYNMALGERRAQSVRRYLGSLGLSTGSISVTSVGEEMARGTDEGSWSQDRNVSASEQ